MSSYKYLVFYTIADTRPGSLIVTIDQPFDTESGVEELKKKLSTTINIASCAIELTSAPVLLHARAPRVDLRSTALPSGY